MQTPNLNKDLACPDVEDTRPTAWAASTDLVPDERAWHGAEILLG